MNCISFVSAGAAFLMFSILGWALQDRAIEHFEGWRGRERSGWRALACFSLGLGMFAIAIAIANSSFRYY